MTVSELETALYGALMMSFVSVSIYILAILSIFYLIQGLLNIIRNRFKINLDDSDNIVTGKRSGFYVRTDYKTGVQYLVTTDGHVTPRLNPDGTLMTISKKDD